MSYKGTVKNGRVILPRHAKLANGTEVKVTPVVAGANDFTDMLVGISKKVRGLPRDLAAQHDHYLYQVTTKEVERAAKRDLAAIKKDRKAGRLKLWKP